MEYLRNLLCGASCVLGLLGILLLMFLANASGRGARKNEWALNEARRERVARQQADLVGELSSRICEEPEPLPAGQVSESYELPMPPIKPAPVIGISGLVLPPPPALDPSDPENAELLALFEKYEERQA